MFNEYKLGYELNFFAIKRSCLHLKASLKNNIFFYTTYFSCKYHIDNWQLK